MTTIPTAGHDPAKTSAEVLRIELLIAGLLRAGVFLSFVIVLVGISSVVISGQSGYQQIKLDDLGSLIAYHEHAPAFPDTLSDVINGLLAFKPYAIITAGLLVLIATPIMRVAVSIIAFAREHDWLYVSITAFVLAVLLLSLAIGEAGG
jgi:uncharacterized membrane protein